MKAVDLGARRKDAGLRQNQLADLLGWNQESIIDIERGRIGIDEATYQLLCRTIDNNAAAHKTKPEVTP